MRRTDGSSIWIPDAAELRSRARNRVVIWTLVGVLFAALCGFAWIKDGHLPQGASGLLIIAVMRYFAVVDFRRTDG